jgi:hypothetical protein
LEKINQLSCRLVFTVYTTLLVLMIDHDGSDDVEVGIIMKFTVNRFLENSSRLQWLEYLGSTWNNIGLTLTSVLI